MTTDFERKVLADLENYFRRYKNGRVECVPKNITDFLLSVMREVREDERKMMLDAFSRTIDRSIFAAQHRPQIKRNLQRELALIKPSQ